MERFNASMRNDFHLNCVPFLTVLLSNNDVGVRHLAEAKIFDAYIVQRYYHKDYVVNKSKDYDQIIETMVRHSASARFARLRYTTSWWAISVIRGAPESFLKVFPIMYFSETTHFAKLLELTPFLYEAPGMEIL
ncbi:hypothetical protein EVAR_85265_1 [Eumeta japonica]|uniref:Uncharacterized protein n=1 Tax=Eumeta variegata TaxID=151549 RepID=A0A4C1VA51_EUMVA|nr:hypothetical protein EVAR_85265_1 [Eumeta japonica]